jgi:hypothetical protein
MVKSEKRPEIKQHVRFAANDTFANDTFDEDNCISLAGGATITNLILQHRAESIF